MEKFISHTGTGIPLRRSNVDTDQIIPAVYLKRVTRSGFEDGLFAAWRNDPEFVLNKAEFKAATILVAGVDFGTGSSREHAVWALQNSLKGGLLTVIMPQAEVEKLWAAIEADPAMAITVDLDSKSVAYNNERISFDLDDYTRWRLMEGLDDIGLTMRNLGDVEKFEEKRANFKPKTLPVLS
jgi:3-isopropylmalate/(R)-2-methylmalate dehydratase small subunit